MLKSLYMRYKWLNKQNNKEVIIFFNGWGMDENIVTHLSCNNYDIVMFYDYNTLDTTFNFSELSNYTKRYLVAWSMGVMIATLFNIDYTSSTAINGTLDPINDSYGIPTKIYDLTIKGFSTAGAKKFVKNMFDKETLLPDINREFENQKSELTAIKNYTANKNFIYSKILISNNDKIIPTKNQTKYWGTEPNIESGHCPFLLFNSWDELL